MSWHSTGRVRHSKRKGEPSMNTIETTEPVVSIGIEAAVVAAHQVANRGPGIAEDFWVQPTLAGLEELTVRLADWAPAMVVAERTAGTWLLLLHAICESGCRVGFVANRDSARLRKAIAGANKTDVIDADMLARSPEILGVEQAPVPPAGQIGLRRAMRRRRATTAPSGASRTIVIRPASLWTTSVALPSGRSTRSVVVVPERGPPSTLALPTLSTRRSGDVGPNVPCGRPLTKRRCPLDRR